MSLFTFLYKSIFTWFRKCSIMERFLIVILVIGFFYIFYLKLDSINNLAKQNEFLKSEIKKDKILIDSLNLLIVELPKKGKTINTNGNIKSKSITKKLKEDETTIDKRTISDDERKRFLSRYD